MQENAKSFQNNFKNQSHYTNLQIFIDMKV